MAILTFEQKPINLAPGETLLAALLAAGVILPNSCRAGLCQTCLVQAVEGKVPAAAQQGLPDTLKAQGYLMACVCVPEGPMTIVRAGDMRKRTGVSIRSIDKLSPTVIRLRLEPEEPFSYRAGQFLALEAPDGTLRNYSIASVPEEESFLELHIRLLPNGRMGRLIAEELSCGDRLAISGPFGSCFYEGLDPDQPLILAGTGTGLAPLWGILRDALRRGHRGPVRLYHGALDRGGLYLAEELQRLSASRANFSYHPCIPGETGPGAGDLSAAVINGEPRLATAAFFLCGNPDLVSHLKRTLFLKGAKLDRLRTDAFRPAA